MTQFLPTATSFASITCPASHVPGCQPPLFPTAVTCIHPTATGFALTNRPASHVPGPQPSLFRTAVSRFHHLATGFAFITRPKSHVPGSQTSLFCTAVTRFITWQQALLCSPYSDSPFYPMDHPLTQLLTIMLCLGTEPAASYGCMGCHNP